MKNKTCIQLKKISKVFYGIFIAIAVIVFAVFAIQAFEEISSSNIDDGIFQLILGLIIGGIIYFIGIFGYILLKGYILFIENSCRLVNEARVSEKNQNDVKELLELISTKFDSQEQEPVKEDLSHIKKSTKQSKVTLEEQELLNEAKATPEMIQLKALDTLAIMADGKATKIIIPSEIQGVAGLVSSIKEIAKSE